MYSSNKNHSRKKKNKNFKIFTTLIIIFTMVIGFSVYSSNTASACSFLNSRYVKNWFNSKKKNSSNKKKSTSTGSTGELAKDDISNQIMDMNKIENNKEPVELSEDINPTTTTTTSSNNDSSSEDSGDYVKNICSTFSTHLTPAKDEVSLPIFCINFPDTNFSGTGELFSDKELQQALFDENSSSSMTTFIKNASYDKLTVSGDVYFYTAKNNISYYEKDNGGFETLAMEALKNFDNSIDFSKYDSDSDGCIDAFSIDIAGTHEFWHGCQATWYYNPNFTLDGKKPYNYIVNDSQPFKNNLTNFVNVMCHEFGHCMGLPDLYRYNTNDYENMKGIAGSAVMEDMRGDYCMFSKLALGWLKEKNVQVYDSGTKDFTIHSAQTSGECLVIPRKDLKSDNVATGEYFIVQYDTPDKNMKDYLNNSHSKGGVRVLHIEGETMPDYYGSGAFKYNGFSKHYDTSHQGITIAKLVNNNKNYYHSGDTVTPSTEGFGWYDSNGKVTVSPNLSISFKDDGNDGITCTVSEN